MWADLPDWMIELDAECEKVCGEVNSIDDVELIYHRTHNPTTLCFDLTGTLEINQGDSPRLALYRCLKMIALHIKG